MRTTLIAVILVIFAGQARSGELQAVKPGVMCASPEALAKLTLPDGSSRDAQSNLIPLYQAIKKSGGCIDIQKGIFVNVIESRRNTSIVTYDSGYGTQKYVIPNIDFNSVQTRAKISLPTQAPLPMKAMPPDRDAATQPPTKTSFQSADKLDATFVAFSFDKLTNSPPDIDAYAETTAAYQNASAFNRDEILSREKSRLQSFYNELDPHVLRSTTLTVSMHQYDAEKGGYEIEWTDSHFIPFDDPANHTRYGIHLSNFSQFILVPVGAPDQARIFARKFSLRSEPGVGTNVIYRLVLKVDQALPQTYEEPGPLRATIVAAEVTTMDEKVLYVFPKDASAEAKNNEFFKNSDATDVRGLHIGMKFQEADAIGAKGWALRREPSGGPGGIFMNNHVKTSNYETCGDIDDYANGANAGNILPVKAYSDCIAFHADQPSPDGSLTEVESVQYLSGSHDLIRKALIGKYGKPSSAGLEHGEVTQMKWIRPDTLNKSLSVEITASIAVDFQNQELLEIRMVPYNNPYTKPATPADVTPKL